MPMPDDFNPNMPEPPEEYDGPVNPIDPRGEWAIVELFGHTTLVGRVTEVERFGAKMMALEPLFNGELLPPVFHGGAAIYRLTPCSFDVAEDRQPRHDYQLPASIRAILPLTALPTVEPPPDFDENPLDDDEEITF